jgi:dienelactone hydrolase
VKARALLRIWIALCAGPALLAGRAAAETLTVPVDYEGRQIELAANFERPEAGGPFPAVILLHGCGGNDAYARRRSEYWGELLRQRGYATLILDSFRARGYSNICNNGKLVPTVERAKDVYAAAYVLAARADVRGDRIAAIGFSHGGGTVLSAAAGWEELIAWEQRLATRGKLVALVGFYPGCRDTLQREFRLPILVLTGASDDWSLAKYCQAHAARIPATAPPFRLHIYPGAYHDFDVDGPEHYVVGHKLAYDAAATADARVELVSFLRQYLN